jgi:DNA invertase Pin-like site-specific DNA recombinase
MKTICALYARVSTKRQSVEAQLSELRGWCARNGWDIYREYVDIGISGRRASRPGLIELLKDAHAGHFQAVVVVKLDRFGRNVVDVINNVLELHAIQCRFICASQGIDTNDRSPMGKLLIHVLALVAELEADLIGERIKAGVEYAKEHGTRSGNTIGGQRKIFNREKVLELHRQGLSYREIAQQMKIGLGTAHRVCSTSLDAEGGIPKGSTGLDRSLQGVPLR